MIVIKDEKQLANALSTRINILQCLNICIRTVILHALHNIYNKDVHKYLFTLKGQELLDEILSKIKFSDREIKVIERVINKYIDDKKIQLKDKIQLDCNETALKNFLNIYLLKSNYWKLILNELRIIKNVELPSSLNDILNSNLNVGDYIPISERILRKELHGMLIKPLIYVNGNIIWGNSQSTLNAAQAQREHHNQILLRYLNDESLHKNDIVHLSMDEWKTYDELRISNVCDFARLVTDDNIFICMFGELESSILKASKLIHDKYNKPVFMITNQATYLKRIASRLIKKDDINYFIIRLY